MAETNPTNPTPAGAGGQNNGPEGGQAGAGNQPQAVEIDYDKIASLVAGKQAVTEDTVLKGYFKQQGLSKEEMDQAITSFKNQKKASTPDVGAMQTQIDEANKAVLKTQIENKALLMHSELGVDLNTIPLIMKLADLSGVIVDGAINEDGLKEALNAVLESVPQFKVQTQVQQQGFRQVGAGQGNNNGGNAPEPKAMAQKRWNRFNH